jgi:hypothetical protein
MHLSGFAAHHQVTCHHYLWLGPICPAGPLLPHCIDNSSGNKMRQFTVHQHMVLLRLLSVPSGPDTSLEGTGLSRDRVRGSQV